MSIFFLVFLCFSGVAFAQDTIESEVDSPNAEASVQKFWLGPLVSLGWPHPISVSFSAHTSENLGAEFSYGRASFGPWFFDARITNFEMKLKWFPWNGVFNLQSTFGTQKVELSLGKSIGLPASDRTVGASVAIEESNPYVVLGLGWQKIWTSGFTLGTEFGYQMNFNAHTKLKSSFSSSEFETQVRETEEFQKLERRVQNVGNTLGNVNVPNFTPLRIGWHF